MKTILDFRLREPRQRQGERPKIRTQDTIFGETTREDFTVLKATRKDSKP
jgi:hypothetical protein